MLKTVSLDPENSEVTVITSKDFETGAEIDRTWLDSQMGKAHSSIYNFLFCIRRETRRGKLGGKLADTESERSAEIQLEQMGQLDDLQQDNKQQYAIWCY
jgi:hypothetical protein